MTDFELSYSRLMVFDITNLFDFTDSEEHKNLYDIKVSFGCHYIRYGKNSRVSAGHRCQHCAGVYHANTKNQAETAGMEFFTPHFSLICL